MIENAAVAIGKFRPQFQIALDRFRIERRQHRRLEISHLAGIIGDVIAERVANRFAARAFVHDVPDGGVHLLHCVGAAKHKKHDTRALASLCPGEIFQHVIANQFLRRAMTRIGFGHDRFCVALRQLRARREHARADEIETRARNQSRDDPAGARFAHRIRRDDGVGKFFVLHVDLARL